MTIIRVIYNLKKIFINLLVMDPCKTTVGSSGGLYGLMAAMLPYCIGERFEDDIYKAFVLLF